MLAADPVDTWAEDALIEELRRARREIRAALSEEIGVGPQSPRIPFHATVGPLVVA